MSTHARGRSRGWLPLLLGISVLACEEITTGPDVSDTEIWRLELEQTDDGSEAIYRRRGTVTLLMRLNHTTQPDPACAGREDPNITTFLADVEAPGARLQPSAEGTASGSWNCFGFSGEVRLNDGTVYVLTSEELRFALETDTLAPRMTDSTVMIPHRWSSEARRGHFLFAPASHFEYEPFDSHFDVRVQNLNEASIAVLLRSVGGGRTWRHRDLSYVLAEPFDPLVPGEVVLANRTHTISWPHRQASLFHPAGARPTWYEIFAGEGLEGIPWQEDITPAVQCFLDDIRRQLVELIVHPDLNLECGEGWLGSVDFRVSPRRLFIPRGMADTIRVEAFPVDTVYAESSNPGLRIVVDRDHDVGNAPLLNFDADIEVTAAPDALRGESGVVITAISSETGEELLDVVPVEVFALTVRTTPDTVRLAPGGTGTAVVRLERDGLAGLDIRFSATDLPPGVFLVPPTFSPGSTDRDSSTMTLRVDAGAVPDVYRFTVCATIVVDPRQRCHAASVVMAVVEERPSERYDLTVATSASNDVLFLGREAFFNVLVSSLGGVVSTGVEATDRLPRGFSYLRHEASTGSYDPASGVWTIGTVNAGPAATLRIFARADSVGVSRNVATLTAGIAGDTNPANDSDTVTVNVVGQ